MHRLEFDPAFAAVLPAACALLKSANLTLHPGVGRVILHGSRGLAGGYRPDSDVDLSLVVEPAPAGTRAKQEVYLRQVLAVTLENWHAPVEADLAAVFDVRGCGLKCFGQASWEQADCALGGTDCFGLYKIQKGFHGLVVDAGVEVRRMIPCIQVWRRG